MGDTTEFQRHPLAWLPNAITLLRILLAPLAAASLWIGFDRAPYDPDTANLLYWLAGSLFLTAAVSDFLDGFLARAWNVESAFGAFLDPIADKLLVGLMLIAFVHGAQYAPPLAVPTFFIIARDITITALRLPPFKRAGVSLPVSTLAKYKTALEFFAIAWPFIFTGLSYFLKDSLLANESLRSATLDVPWVLSLWFACCLSLLTGAEYVRAWLKARA
ncbi:CDP-diacylglycerol--glycerol-3-phosphate 3-phosphatidyltransferase [Woodsholea maritima]|uniref:CDP-diacylglycerol--glycerol-3-phosphate 3-phosphatidyltransferase n=1 Tax=Woodsholea maritima TaxID=240237 RepID=UPI000371D403|nr:CDP-diacylglycerol--glycerol-3-phosphate 3-phosphatidyltransferase [Woodsholea maritima]